MADLTVSIMQPYFLPYAGYFRLMAAADVFVLYDCVQFARRGRVHRCEVRGPSGEMEWLTLPLARQPRDVLIRDLSFADNARAMLDQRLARLSWIDDASGPMAGLVKDYLNGELHDVTSFLASGMQMISGLLGLECRMIRSSSLEIPRHLKGQDRIITIAKILGAHRYVNAPGGRALYDRASFEREGLELCFLPAFHGRQRSILPQLLSETPDSIRADILGQTVLECASA